MYDEQQDPIEIKAKELTAQYYLEKIMKTGWTVTHTEQRYDQWDVTATNGENTVYLETKIRNINPNDYKDEGCLIDESKVDFLEKKGDSVIVQFFPLTNEAYCWPVQEKENWRTTKMWCRATNFTNRKVEKQVYLMPFDDLHVRQVDMTDYDTIYSDFYNKVKNNEIQ